MAVIRTQYGVVSASTTVGATSVSSAIVLPRPADAPETNTIDWVVRPAFRKEFESGRCVIGFDSLLGIAGVLLVKVEVMALQPFNSLAPIDLSFSQFPSPPSVGAVPLLRTILDLSASPSTSIFTCVSTDTKTFDILKSILVRADEYVQVTLYNSTGAPITGKVEARYDFGLNASNFGSIPLLI